MIGANILISIKTLCILPAIVYFLTKNIAQNVFVSLFQMAAWSRGKAPSSSEENEILFKISAGGVGKCPVGRFSRRTLAGDPVAVYMNSAFMHIAI